MTTGFRRKEGETWRVWGDEFHAVYIGERKLRSTTSSWSNLEVWTSSPWLRCQEQRLHKGWRRCHKTLGWCKKLQLVEHVPSLGMGVQLRCSGAGTGTGSRLITLLGWWFFFSARGSWGNGRQFSCHLRGNDFVPASAVIVQHGRPLWLCSQKICGKRSRRENISLSPHLSSV